MNKAVIATATISLMVFSIEYSGRRVDANAYDDYMNHGQTTADKEIQKQVTEIENMRYDESKKYNAILLSADQNIDIQQANDINEINLNEVSNLYDMVEQEANIIGLDPRIAKTVIDTESGFRNFAHNGNRNGSYDSGLAQLNNKGEPLEHYYNKNITLGDGRTVKVNFLNYKKDARLNVAMGLRRYKAYMDELGNPFSAYACYNIGPAVKRVLRNHKHSDVATIITAVRKAGYSQGANNLKNNFLVKYKKWTGGTFYK